MNLLFKSQLQKKLLTLDLVPQTSWFKNARAILTVAEWDKVRKEVYRKAAYLCEICGGQGPKWPVECHEVWEYSEGSTNLQKLAGMTALCPACHSVKHYGLAQVQGREMAVYAHLKAINKWADNQAKQHIRTSFQEWEKRSKLKWEVDVSLLGTYEIDLMELEAKTRTARGEDFREEEIMLRLGQD